MRVAFYGAGGVGGYYAAVLARAGCEVAVVARGAHLSAIRADGLRVRTPGGAFQVSPGAASDDPAEIGPADVVVVSVKSFDLPAVAARIGPLLGPATLVVPLLNGVDAHEVLSPAVGRERTGKGLTRIMSKVSAPGAIHHMGVEPYVAIAEWDGRASPRVQAFVAALTEAGVEAEVPPDIDAALWFKFLFVSSLGSVCAACRAPFGPVLAVPESRDLLRRAMEEVVALAAARGVVLPEGAVRQAMTMAGSFPPDGTSSLQRDIAAGLPSELEAWPGAVARLGAECGVPTPVNSFVWSILLPGEVEARRRRGVADLPTGAGSDGGSAPC